MNRIKLDKTRVKRKRRHARHLFQTCPVPPLGGQQMGCGQRGSVGKDHCVATVASLTTCQ